MTNQQKLWVNLANPEYRAAYVSSTIAARIAVRIHNLRQKVGWSQAKLADEAGMKQARISILEQADYENSSINTLKRIAAAFKVALIVDFVSFPKFIEWSKEIDSSTVVPQSFCESDAVQASFSKEHFVPQAFRSSQQTFMSSESNEAAAMGLLKVFDQKSPSHQSQRPSMSPETYLRFIPRTGATVN